MDMQDPQTAAALQALQSDPTAMRQLQTEMQQMQLQAGLKQGISMIQKMCWGRCIESIQANRLTGGEEACMMQCANNTFAIQEAVQKHVQNHLEEQSRAQGFYRN